MPSPNSHRPGLEPAGLRWLSRATQLLVNSGLAVASLGVLLSLALIVWSVVMRYAMSRPQVWVDEAVGFMLVGMVMLGAAQVLRRGEHIGIDVLTERLSPHAARWARIWADIAALSVAAILVNSGVRSMLQAMKFGIVTEGNIQFPLWWLMMLMPLGGALMGLVAIEALWRRALNLPMPATEDSHAQEAK